MWTILSQKTKALCNFLRFDISNQGVYIPKYLLFFGAGERRAKVTTNVHRVIKVGKITTISSTTITWLLLQSLWVFALIRHVSGRIQDWEGFLLSLV